ncbi:MAG: hypothetical protein FWD34_09790 [Oscillospiraceae bacterium]|nr:hypothetical protein [Oscillospiraceae bacterium]
MEKSKLGISISLVGAALFFFANLSVLPLVVLAGYILLFESNIWLKKSAVKAVAIVIIFMIIRGISYIINSGPDTLNDIINLVNANAINMSWFYRLNSMFHTGLGVAERIILLGYGFVALITKGTKSGPIDKMLDKHFN